MVLAFQTPSEFTLNFCFSLLKGRVKQAYFVGI